MNELKTFTHSLIHSFTHSSEPEYQKNNLLLPGLLSGRSAHH